MKNFAVLITTLLAFIVGNPGAYAERAIGSFPEEVATAGDTENDNSSTASKAVIEIYLAGPEVFMPNPLAKGSWKKSVIEKINQTLLQDAPFEFKGNFPMDGELEDFGHNPETAMRIYQANVDMMKTSDIIIANMSQFRGPSMDVGTAFEMGFMAALQRPVFGYYNMKETYCTEDQKLITLFDCALPGSDATTLYLEKLQDFGDGSFVTPNFPTSGRDKYTHTVENFGLSDNLMMVGSVRWESHKTYGYDVASSFEGALREAASHVRASLTSK